MLTVGSLPVEMTHPTVQIDDVIHQRVRLGILAVRVGADFADFTFLRDSRESTDGNLSRHLQVLEEPGPVTIDALRGEDTE